MSRYLQGTFKPKNPKKYVGEHYPIYRSSWELKVFIWLDEHPSIIHWSSEGIKIPYLNPITQRKANYIPDLLIEYADKSGKKHVEIIEIKPMKQTLKEKAKTQQDRAALIVNEAKWKAAYAFCKQNGINFRILTEKDIFFRNK